MHSKRYVELEQPTDRLRRIGLNSDSHTIPTNLQGQVLAGVPFFLCAGGSLCISPHLDEKFNLVANSLLLCEPPRVLGIKSGNARKSQKDGLLDNSNGVQHRILGYLVTRRVVLDWPDGYLIHKKNDTISFTVTSLSLVAKLWHPVLGPNPVQEFRV